MEKPQKVENAIIRSIVVICLVLFGVFVIGAVKEGPDLFEKAIEGAKIHEACKACYRAHGSCEACPICRTDEAWPLCRKSP
jgi:hypothetical protein